MSSAKPMFEFGVNAVNRLGTNLTMHLPVGMRRGVWRGLPNRLKTDTHVARIRKRISFEEFETAGTLLLKNNSNLNDKLYSGDIFSVAPNYFPRLEQEKNDLVNTR